MDDDRIPAWDRLVPLHRSRYVLARLGFLPFVPVQIAGRLLRDLKRSSGPLSVVAFPISLGLRAIVLAGVMVSWLLASPVLASDAIQRRRKQGEALSEEHFNGGRPGKLIQTTYSYQLRVLWGKD